MNIISSTQKSNPNSEINSFAEKVRLIAFYLPQYHPIPENDEWWGKGFTEWTNVTKAKPLFRGHYQPQLPADLGFYDLRLPEARQAQADLAREYGIGGFCYYHYWFNGRRLLERPFDEVLKSGEPDFPFCLCWANENWTRTWDGWDKQVLLAQNYCEEDDIEHIRWLVKAFRDERYIRIDGKPLFLVYRVEKLPDPIETTRIWREEARRAGIGELFLCTVENVLGEHKDPAEIGFDAAVEFQPDFNYMPPPLYKKRRWYRASKLGLISPAYHYHNIYDYNELVDRMLKKPAASYRRFPGVTPSWDNSARRKNGATVMKNPTPAVYQRWLTSVISTAANDPRETPVFINAWNEWAEGNHLEPCQALGRAYLEATRTALTDALQQL